MRILIAGATGFIGQHLVDFLLKTDCQVSIITQSRTKAALLFRNHVNIIEWQELTLDQLAPHDAVINLAGANIGSKRWNEKRKQLILSSRVETTKRLAHLCAQLSVRSPALLNASAIGVYGLQQTSKELPPPLTEQTNLCIEQYPCFLAEVARKWEQATQEAINAEVRVVNMRFGVVLSNHGGAMTQLARPFKLGIGGIVGSGNQAFSWISLDDLIRAIDFLLNNPKVTGAINLTSPQCIQQRQLAKAIGKALHRPSLIKTPAWALRLALGEMADELILNGQHVYPQRLLDLGFEFHRPNIEDTLRMQ